MVIKTEKGFEGTPRSLLFSQDSPILMQCRTISLFPEDRQMRSEDDSLDQQGVPQESLKETTGKGRCPDNRGPEQFHTEQTLKTSADTIAK